jgi:hypothetical protein
MMRGSELISLSRPPGVRTQSELSELSIQIKEKWPSLPQPVWLPWTERPLVSVDRSGVPWVIGPAERDPLRDSRGRTVIPRRQRAKLKRIADLGVPFQRIAIAHELNPNGPIHDYLPALKEGPRTCSDEVARVLVGAVPAHPRVERAVSALDAVVGGAASAVHGHLLTAILDPIIFGIISPTPPNHGQLCLWYPLAAWRW